MPQPSLGTALQNINLKKTIKNINQKSIFNKDFVSSFHLLLGFESNYTSQLFFHFPNISNIICVVNNFSTIK